MGWLDNIAMTFGGNPAAFGSLSPQMTPEQMQKMQTSQMLMGLGTGMMANAKSNPVQAFGNAYQNWQQNAGQNLQNQLIFQKFQDEQQNRKTAETRRTAMDAWVKTQPQNMQELYQAYPDEAAGAYIKSQFGGDKSTAPSGYRYTTDQQGNQALEAIPGGPAAPNSEIAKDIAKGIMDGTQPPNTQGLYRYGAQTRAELSKQGFDLSKAQLEFNATTRALATMNGPQQTRIRQNIGTLSESLPLVRDLAKQWKGGKFPPLNRANLIAAKNGLYGPEAQSLSTRLDAEIGDVTAELAGVYMGGNSPTDHAFDLAKTQLSADWSEKTLLDSLDLAETNVRYRRNALNQPVSGVPNNPYDPRGPVPSINYGQESGTSQPPEGISPEEWQYMTPEERALWGQ